MPDKNKKLPSNAELRRALDGEDIHAPSAERFETVSEFLARAFDSSGTRTEFGARWDAVAAVRDQPYAREIEAAHARENAGLRAAEKARDSRRRLGADSAIDAALRSNERDAVSLAGERVRLEALMRELPPSDPAYVKADAALRAVKASEREAGEQALALFEARQQRQAAGDWSGRPLPTGPGGPKQTVLADSEFDRERERRARESDPALGAYDHIRGGRVPIPDAVLERTEKEMKAEGFERWSTEAAALRHDPLAGTAA